MLSRYSYLDTPCLLVDKDIAMDNIHKMQETADSLGIKLRPHIKTHRMPYFANLQLEAGACGIACAKLGEAEVMADNGVQDILIANEIVGLEKYERLRKLHHRVHIRIGIDSEFQLSQMEQVFDQEARPLEVLIEYDVGENRTGVCDEEHLRSLVKTIMKSKAVVLKGVFSHEGHCYYSDDSYDCHMKAQEAYRSTLHAADIMRELGAEIDTVSIGSTPSVLQEKDFPGITELRLGTYIFFDVGQSHAIGDYGRCAATVLTSVLSKPVGSRVVIDAGAKALVPQNRNKGICSTEGFGVVKGAEHIHIDRLYDEHGIINNYELSDTVPLGGKIEIIPSHICPTVNLYDSVYLVSDGDVLCELPVLCRGKSR